MPRTTIAEGWASFEQACIPANAPAVQREGMRLSFYGGATVLFTSIMEMLEPGTEATDADIAGMEAIDAELRAFSAGETLTGIGAN